ncbi:hypothetical protein [Scytonema sp. NUACC26]|uniref:hypothetical protein n=1 Tax=Scytonema sp. NUACC26 TaxID=3140176 RepID=UPI0034DBB486
MITIKISQEPVVADGLGEKGTLQGTYVGMISSNTCIIARDLGGKYTPFAPRALLHALIGVQNLGEVIS